MTDQSTIDALAELGAQVREASEERDRLIFAALAEGHSQREVARAAGLSHTAVQNMVRRAG